MFLKYVYIQLLIYILLYTFTIVIELSSVWRSQLGRRFEYFHPPVSKSSAESTISGVAVYGHHSTPLLALEKRDKYSGGDMFGDLLIGII